MLTIAIWAALVADVILWILAGFLLGRVIVVMFSTEELLKPESQPVHRSWQQKARRQMIQLATWIVNAGSILAVVYLPRHLGQSSGLWFLLLMVGSTVGALVGFAYAPIVRWYRRGRATS